MIRLLAQSPCKPVNHRYLDAMSDHEFRDRIVVYKTKPHCKTNASGLAILSTIDHCNYKFGFIYHKYLVYNNKKISNAKYSADSRWNAIMQAIKCDREVYMFCSFEEFAQFAAKNCEY